MPDMRSPNEDLEAHLEYAERLVAQARATRLETMRDSVETLENRVERSTAALGPTERRREWVQILGRLLDTAIHFTQADRGNVQMLDVNSGRLRIEVHRGFQRPFLDYFESVVAGRYCACGAVLARGGRVTVTDITDSPIFDRPTIEVLLDSGVRSVQSSPLLDRGRIVGVLSTHSSRVWVQPDTSHLLDSVVELAARVVRMKLPAPAA
jgi:GAF domain-containing protein